MKKDLFDVVAWIIVSGLVIGIVVLPVILVVGLVRDILQGNYESLMDVIGFCLVLIVMVGGTWVAEQIDCHLKKAGFKIGFDLVMYAGGYVVCTPIIALVTHNIWTREWPMPKNSWEWGVCITAIVMYWFIIAVATYSLIEVGDELMAWDHRRQTGSKKLLSTST